MLPLAWAGEKNTADCTDASLMDLENLFMINSAQLYNNEENLSDYVENLGMGGHGAPWSPFSAGPAKFLPQQPAAPAANFAHSLRG